MTKRRINLTRRTFLGGAALFGISLWLSPATALAAPTAAEKQAEANAALAALNAMQEELDIASADYFSALAEQEAAQAAMDAAQARIDEASALIKSIQEHLGTRARSMYRRGSSSFLDVLLGSSSFEEFASNWSLLERLNKDDADLIQQTKDLRAEIQLQKEEYARQERIAAEKTAEALAIKQKAESTVAAMQATYDSLSAEAARLLEEERAAEERRRQEEEERRRQEQEQQQQNQQKPSYSEPPYNAVTGNAVADRAYSYIGKAEYVWGGCAPGEFDCSGFVSYCLTGRYSRLGTTYTFMAWPETSNPQIGDVCTNWSHCGIYVGGGQMIHSATYGVGVIKSAVQSGMIYVRPPW